MAIGKVPSCRNVTAPKQRVTSISQKNLLPTFFEILELQKMIFIKQQSKQI
jgi:hypothetical protein